MGDVKVTLSSKNAIEGKAGYRYTFNKVEDNKVVGSITIYDYEGDGFDNHDGVVNNKFGEVTSTIFETFMKEDSTKRGYTDAKVDENPATNKKYEDVKGTKKDKGFEITNDNKTEFNLGSLAKNIDYKNPTSSYQNYTDMFKSSSSFSFNPMTMSGAGGVNMPFLFEGGSGCMPTKNVDYAKLSNILSQGRNEISFNETAGIMSDYGMSPFAMDSVITRTFNKILSCFNINFTGQNTLSVDDVTKKKEEDAKKLEALKTEAKNINVTVEEKDNLESLQTKVDAKKLETLKTEATKLKITFEEKITLSELQKLVDDKKAELAKTNTNSSSSTDNKKKDGKEDGKTVTNNKTTKPTTSPTNTTKTTTTPTNITTTTNAAKTTKNVAGQTIVETTDSKGNKVVITMDKNMNIILKTTSYSDGSYKKEMPGDPTFNKPGNISLTVHKDGKAEITCTARRADNLYTPIITHRYENYKDNNTTDLESWTKQGQLISTTVNPNCKSYKPYTFKNRKYELAQEAKKAQENVKKSQDELKKIQDEAKKYN